MQGHMVCTQYATGVVEMRGKVTGKSIEDGFGKQQRYPAHMHSTTVCAMGDTPYGVEWQWRSTIKSCGACLLTGSPDLARRPAHGRVGIRELFAAVAARSGSGAVAAAAVVKGHVKAGIAFARLCKASRSISTKRQSETRKAN